MVDSANTIEQKLKRAWHEERRFVHLRGASRFVIWLIAMIVLDFVIDWGIIFKSRMTGNMGFLLLGINVAVLGWVLWHEWLRHLQPFNPLLVALEVEGRHPELSSVLVSYTQLEGLTNNQPNVSRELIEAMRDQAISITRPLDFREIVDFGQLKKLLLVAAGVLLLFGALSAGWPEHVSTLFRRLAGGSATYPTQTQIVEVSSDATIKVGDSADVMVRAAGVIPEDGRIYTRLADGEAGWKPLPMNKDRNQPAFRRQLKELTADTLFYVRVGDDQTEPQRIRVVPAPQVVAARVKLNYPSYINREAGQSDQLNLEVPEGTHVQWQLTCQSPVQRLQVQIGEETIDADADESGKQLSFAATADQSLKYTFQWTVSDSGKEFRYDDVQHSVRVVADAVPEIELLQPTRNGLATVKKNLQLLARAGDDHGLSKAWLVYSIDGSEEQRRPIRDFKGVPSEEFSYAWELAQSIEGIKAGTQVTFAVEVADLHPATQHHLRRSATRQLYIVEPERYLEWYRAELAAQHDEIKRARDAEQVSSTKVKQIRVQEGAAE